MNLTSDSHRHLLMTMVVVLSGSLFRSTTELGSLVAL